MDNAASCARLLLLSGDLMTSSHVSAAADRQNVASATALDAAAMAEKLRANSVALVILDLGLPRLDVDAAVSQVRELAPAARILAFGPHVHEAVLQRARSAGCDQVMSRGQFHNRLDDVVRAIAGAAE